MKPSNQNETFAAEETNSAAGKPADKEAELINEKDPKEKDASSKTKDLDPKAKNSSQSTNEKSPEKNKNKKPRGLLSSMVHSALGLEDEEEKKEGEEEGKEGENVKVIGGKRFALENLDGTPFTGNAGVAGQLAANFSKFWEKDIKGTLSAIKEGFDNDLKKIEENGGVLGGFMNKVNRAMGKDPKNSDKDGKPQEAAGAQEAGKADSENLSPELRSQLSGIAKDLGAAGTTVGESSAAQNIPNAPAASQAKGGRE
jgi:hypothetical protein